MVVAVIECLGDCGEIGMSPDSGQAASLPPPVPRAARQVGDDWRRLCDATMQRSTFDPKLVAGLPGTGAAVAGPRHHARHAVVAVGGAVHGWRNPGRQLAAFHRHPADCAPKGYIWAATARFFGLPVSGYDRFAWGTERCAGGC